MPISTRIKQKITSLNMKKENLNIIAIILHDDLGTYNKNLYNLFNGLWIRTDMQKSVAQTVQINYYGWQNIPLSGRPENQASKCVTIAHTNQKKPHENHSSICKSNSFYSNTSHGCDLCYVVVFLVGRWKLCSSIYGNFFEVTATSSWPFICNTFSAPFIYLTCM